MLASYGAVLLSIESLICIGGMASRVRDMDREEFTVAFGKKGEDAS
jgi:hypothetical protein